MADIMNLEHENVRRKEKFEYEKINDNKCFDHKPNNKPEHHRCCDCKKSICNVIDSIADEEIAIAHILKAESEKIKKAVHLACDVKELVVVNESVGETLKDIIKLQMLLQFKLEEANKALK